MKKAFIVSVLATVLSTSVVSAASAATAPKAIAVQVQQTSFVVNYNDISVRTIKSSGETLVSVKDLSAALGAGVTVNNGMTTVTLSGHSIMFKGNDKQITVDGKKQNLNQPVKMVNGSSFISVRPFVQTLGGTLAVEGGKISINTIKLLEDVANPQFVNDNQVLVSKYIDDTRVDYLVDVKTGQPWELMKSVDTSELMIAPNGMKAAYTDADGKVYVLDFATKQSTQVSADTSIKLELVWSADSSIIYFLQSDKGSVIAQLDPSTGAITKVLDDKVDYKSSLRVSADGKKFTYLVSTLPKATADATDLDKDAVTIDDSGASTQLFLYDSGAAKPAAIALTSTKDDKIFVESADGSVTYFVSVADGNQASTVISVDKDKKISTIFSDGDVEQIVLSSGKLYVLTNLNASSSAIYVIDTTTGTKSLLYNVSADVSGIIVKGSQIGIEQNGQLFVNSSNKWRPITK